VRWDAETCPIRFRFDVAVIIKGKEVPVSLIQAQRGDKRPQLGLMTAPTPFLTGRPHTLIYNRDIYSSGTLGIAFSEPLTTTIEYGLEPLSHEFGVLS